MYMHMIYRSEYFISWQTPCKNSWYSKDENIYALKSKLKFPWLTLVLFYLDNIQSWHVHSTLGYMMCSIQVNRVIYHLCQLWSERCVILTLLVAILLWKRQERYNNFGTYIPNPAMNLLKLNLVAENFRQNKGNVEQDLWLKWY